MVLKTLKNKPKEQWPTDEKKEVIYLAGSGPSCADYTGFVDVATKKLTIPAKYQVARYIPWWHKKEKTYHPHFMAYKQMDDSKYPVIDHARFYQADWKYWDEYFMQFRPSRVTKKPSTGLCAVFCIYQRWMPDTIGLIGFDWVMDGNKIWNHDPRAEKECILSLMNILDLRNGDILPRS